jgi:nucleoside-diphosphate-sugar epimerase
MLIRRFHEANVAGDGDPGAELVFDPAKPDGMPRKVLDVTRIRALGWQPTIDLPTGLRSTYDWYRAADRIRGQHGATTAAYTLPT